MNLNVMSLNNRKKINNTLADYKNWRVANSSGIMKIKDNSGKRYNATSYFGQGCYFDGVSQNISIPNAEVPYINPNSFTVSINVTYLNPNIGNYLLFLGTKDVQLQKTTPTNLRFYSWDSVVENEVSFGANFTGVLTFTFDGTTYRGYRNGVLVGSVVGGAPVNSSQAFSLGARTGVSNYCNCGLKDFFVFNRVLSEAEIMKSYMYPNEFFLDAQNDASCTLNIPMCEKYNHSQLYKSNKFVVNNTSIDGNTATNYWTKNQDNSFTLTQVDLGSGTPFLNTGISAVSGMYYEINYTVINAGGSNINSDQIGQIPCGTIGTFTITKKAVITGFIQLKRSSAGQYCTIKINSIKLAVPGVLESSDFNDGTVMGFTGLYDATVSNVSNQLRVTAVVNNPYVGKSYTSVIGNYYMLRCTINGFVTSGSVSVIASSIDDLAGANLGAYTYQSIPAGSKNRDIVFIVKATTTLTKFIVLGNSTTAGQYFTIDNWEVTDLGVGNVYPVNNFTTNMRTSAYAQRLTTGLQTSGFKRDYGGFILSKSNYLESDGVGYADTRFIPETNGTYTYEWVTKFKNSGFPLYEGFGIEFGNNMDFYFRRYNGTSTNYIDCKIGTTSLSINSNIILDTYLLCTFVINGNNISVYVNGILKDTITHTYNKDTNTTRTMYIGGINYGVPDKLNINPTRLFKVHKKALTASQVLANYNKYVAKGLLA